MQGHCSLFCGLSFYRTRDTCSLLSRVFCTLRQKAFSKELNGYWHPENLFLEAPPQRQLQNFCLRQKTSHFSTKNHIQAYWRATGSMKTWFNATQWTWVDELLQETTCMEYSPSLMLRWLTCSRELVQHPWHDCAFWELKCTLMWLWPGGINTTAFQGADVRSLCFCRLSERKMTTSGVPPNEVSPQCLGGPPGISICVWCRVCVPAVPSSTCESLFGQASKKPKKLRLLSNLALFFAKEGFRKVGPRSSDPRGTYKHSEWTKAAVAIPRVT